MRIAYIGQKGIGVAGRGGGIEKHVTELAIRMVKKGHEVTVYARRAYCQGVPREFQGVMIKYIPTIYRKNLEAIIHTFFSTIDALFQPYDIIHFHGVGPATVAWIPRLFRPKVRVVVTFHSQDRFHQKWSWFARNYLRFGEWAAVRFPHVCIAVSHTIQVFVRKTFHRQVVYIPNGAEVQTVTSFDQIKQFGLQTDSYILNVGRIVPQKGVHHLIAAFRELDTKKNLVIVGAPSFSERYFEELKRLASADDRVLFLGYQEGEVLKQLFADAYLYVQPSESEGLAVAVLEAMSFGTAALVSDIPENVEVIKNTGFTFANRDIPDLVSQLHKLLHHPALVKEMGARGREMVKEFFSWDVIADRVEEVYVTTRH